jgi:uncharacterized Fe-S cluster protein YjdI
MPQRVCYICKTCRKGCESIFSKNKKSAWLIKIISHETNKLQPSAICPSGAQVLFPFRCGQTLCRSSQGVLLQIPEDTPVVRFFHFGKLMRFTCFLGVSRLACILTIP